MEDMSTPCIEHDGYRLPSGYGQVGRNKRAHRVAWERVHGPIPEGMTVLHRCDNPPCVNVDHLRLGTQADNMADMDAKGRRRTGRQGNPKLTPDQVSQIREALAAGGGVRAIARTFNVGPSTISRIKRGETWRCRRLPRARHETVAHVAM